MITSPSAVGARPDATWYEAISSSVFHVPTMVGGPKLLPLGSPLLSSSVRVVVEIDPSASATPSTAFALATTDSGSSARWVPVNCESKSSSPRTMASMFLPRSPNRSSKTRLTVADSTKVPVMNATPRMTARQVETRRRLCDQSERRVVFSIGIGGDQSPKVYMKSTTASVVGWRISWTMLPSARIRTRSA